MPATVRGSRLPRWPRPRVFAPGGPGVGEVEVFHHDRDAVVAFGQIQQRGDRRPNPPVTPRSSQPRRFDSDRDGCTDQIAGGVEHTRGEVIGVEVHAQDSAGP